MLDIEGLGKTYPGPVRALSDISLQIGPGIFGLLGPNGAGKSTLMRILATLQLPDTGTVNLDGMDLVAEPRNARHFIGYLPQDPGVYPRVTAREMLDYIASLKIRETSSKRRERVNHQLAKVNLTEHADRRLDTYSGGMKQRFGIAAALLGNPKLVIVDEPTAGLDPLERRRFQMMLTEVSQHCVLILSSHIVEDIAGLCTQMALIDQGKILLHGDPRQLIRQLDGKVWESTVPLESFDSIQQTQRVLSWRPDGGRLLVRIWSEAPPVNSLPEMNVVDANLEDLYAWHVA